MVGYKLKDVAQRLRVKEYVIVDILQQHGFSIEIKPHLILNNKHLKLLCAVYVESIKLGFKRILSEKNFDCYENLYKLRFYSEFVREFPVDCSNLTDFKSWVLDENLIADYFQTIISSTRRIRASKVWIKNLYAYFISKIKPNFINLKLLFNSIIPPQLFYIFSGEEENHGTKSNIQDFSMVVFTVFSEVCKYSTVLKTINNEKERITYKQYRTMQLI